MVELTDTIQILNLNTYEGFQNDSPEEAQMFSTKNPLCVIRIHYENMLDCKNTERIIRPYLSKFHPRKYSSDNKTSIIISSECKTELAKIKQRKESYEMVIWKLLLEHYWEI